MNEPQEEVESLKEKLEQTSFVPIESPILKILKDKEGNKLTPKEFIKRWGEGIQNLTPVQKLTNESRATVITLVGFLVCLVALVIFRDKMIVSWFAYGLILIFIGNAWTTTLKWFGIRQQLKYFNNMEEGSDNINKILDELESMEVKGG